MEIDLSHATVISIFPKEIKEPKPGLFPAEFIIPLGTVEKPGYLIIDDNTFYQVDPDPLSEAKEKAYIKVPVKALEVAQSIINDYVNSLIEVELGEAVPGIFAVKGDYRDSEYIKAKFKHEIAEYSRAQRRWFTNLAKSADEIWAKTRSTAGISDLQRIAAEAIGWGKEWLISLDEPSKCPYCKNNIIEGALKCTTCGEILNVEQYNKLKGVSNSNALANSFK